ncbi:hypothetical protein ACQEVS_22125 [Streptomyces sp. CA-181903]|uniref:hypothetical protein n=1 Tax=Streptomyces sp. CA-181903 TaxID=3240055 RepID=UPI003D8FFDC2
MALITTENRRSRRLRRWTMITGAALTAALVPMTTAMAAPPSDSDLEVVRIDPDAAPPGGTTTVHAFVINQGPEQTANRFTVTIDLPEGVTPEGPFYPENCEVLRNNRRVSCSWPAGLAPSKDQTAIIPIRLSTDVPVGTLTGGSVSVRSVDDKNKANDRRPFVITVVESEGA